MVSFVNLTQETNVTATYKLGRNAVKKDARTLRLGDYLTALNPPPASVDWTQKVSGWPMMKNDTVGDCTIAAAGHMVELWSANAGASAVVIPDDQIIAAYTAVTAEENNGQGYDPSTGANDNGCAEIDVLNYWQKTGIGGNTLRAFMQLHPKSKQEVQQGVYLFGGAYIGLALPLSAQGQVQGGLWYVPKTGARGRGRPGSWGGHAVPIVAYDADGVTVVTWGQTLKATWNFIHAYCEEAYVLLNDMWFSAQGKTPDGLDLATMESDLQIIVAA